MRSFLLGLLILGLPAMSLATSIDYGSKGSIGAGTATLTGSATVGDNVILTSPLININSVSATGTVTLATGTLAATSDPNVFTFSGGSLMVVSAGNTLFHGAFSSGTLTLSGTSAFTISGSLSNGTAISAQSDVHGDVQGETIVTPEPSTLGLMAMGTGLIGLARIVRRKKRSSAFDSKSNMVFVTSGAVLFLFYYFRLEDQVPENHLLRLIDKHISFDFVREQLKATL